MIVGFNINKIKIERKKKLVKGMKIKYNMDISKVYEQDLTLPAPNQNILGLDFVFTVDYDPEIADIEINGTVSYMMDKGEFGKILNLWKKTKKLPKDISVPVINVILDKCNIKSLELEQDLSLPTHLPMPSIDIGGEKNDAERYIG